MIETVCSRCGAEEYRLLDPKTGEVVCSYCRNRWIMPALIHQTETEKFLAEQAKQPRIIADNTTETDKQLMDAVTSVARVATGGFLSRAIKGAAIAFAILILLGVLVFYALTFLLR